MKEVPELKTVSEQSATVYKLLLAAGPLTAQEIADELKILPNAVYRVANKMVTLGMLKRRSRYPLVYQANQPNTAMNWFLLAIAHSFREDFPANKGQGLQNDVAVPSLSFIKDRQTLIKRTEKDVSRAKQSVNYIVSGHRVPDSTALAFRQAAARGVKIRAIWQEKRVVSKRVLKDWQALGVDVRYGSVLGLRLFIFDSRTVYLTSYDLRVHDTAFGIRFDYAPIALQMEKLFAENWQKARKV